mgnify:CR=1 FL=1
MIVLDTNVISELWRTAPTPSVLAWMDAQAGETLYLSATTVAELRYGIAAMPPGQRRSVYQARLEAEVLPLFAGRILAFDLTASAAYAELMMRARTQGLGIAHADACIAACTAAQSFAIATRDASPFQAAGLTVINPWGEPF